MSEKVGVSGGVVGQVAGSGGTMAGLMAGWGAGLMAKCEHEAGRPCGMWERAQEQGPGPPEGFTVLAEVPRQ